MPDSATFKVEADDGADVLSDAEQTYALHAGDNGTLLTLTLLGNANNFEQGAQTCASSSCTGLSQLEDAAFQTITTPGSAFADGPVVLNGLPGSTITPGTIASPNATGTYSITVTCAGYVGPFQVEGFDKGYFQMLTFPVATLGPYLTPVGHVVTYTCDANNAISATST